MKKAGTTAVTAYFMIQRHGGAMGSAGSVELTHYSRPAGLPRERQPWLASVTQIFGNQLLQFLAAAGGTGWNIGRANQELEFSIAVLPI